MARLRGLATLAEVGPQAVGGGTPARFEPEAELRHIDAAVPGFAVVDPGLRLSQFVAEFPLCQPGLLPRDAQQPRYGCVGTRVLGLGRHATQNPCRRT